MKKRNEDKNQNFEKLPCNSFSLNTLHKNHVLSWRLKIYFSIHLREYILHSITYPDRFQAKEPKIIFHLEKLSKFSSHCHNF